jgi:hypothetical protein
MAWRMIFIEDHAFLKRRQGLMEDDELFRLMQSLVVHPDAGKTIPGSGGLRKLRWRAKGHGKRGGVRVIYFWWMADEKILLLDIYAKGEQENLSAKEVGKLKGKVLK